MRTLALVVVVWAAALVAAAAGFLPALVRVRRAVVVRVVGAHVTTEVWSVPVDGGRARLVLRDRGHQDAFPVYRNDGSLLFVRPTSLTTTALFSLRGGHVTRLRRLPVFAPLAYSPALDELALPRGRTLQAETPNGRVVRTLARVSATTIPAWSADGTTLVYSHVVRTPVNRYQPELVVVRGGRTRIVPVGFVGSIAVSPTGDRVVFELARRLVLLDLVTGRRRVLAGNVSSPVWSPDGRTVAAGDARGILLVDVRTGRRRRGPAKAAGVSFAPDGRALVYTRLYAAQSMPK